MKLLKKGWSDITINEYYQIQDILNDEDTDELDKTIDIATVLTGMTREELLKTDYNEYTELITEINTILCSGIPENANNKLDSIILDGVKYKIIKELDKVSVGQYIDFQSYLTQEKNMAQILSIFLIPEGKKYAEDYNVAETINTFENKLDIISAKQLCNFFVHWSAKSMHYLLTSYKWRMKMMMMKTNMSKKTKKQINQMINNLINQVGSAM